MKKNKDQIKQDLQTIRKNDRMLQIATLAGGDYMDMLVTGNMFFATSGLEALLNRGEITQEEYDWFKSEEK